MVPVDRFVLPIESVPAADLVAGAFALAVVIVFCWFLFGLLRLIVKLLFAGVFTFLVAGAVLGVCYTALVALGTLRAYVPAEFFGVPTLLAVVALAAAGLAYHRFGRFQRAHAQRKSSSGATVDGALQARREQTRIILRERTMSFVPEAAKQNGWTGTPDR